MCIDGNVIYVLINIFDKHILMSCVVPFSIFVHVNPTTKQMCTSFIFRFMFEVTGVFFSFFFFEVNILISHHIDYITFGTLCSL